MITKNTWLKEKPEITEEGILLCLDKTDNDFFNKRNISMYDIVFDKDKNEFTLWAECWYSTKLSNIEAHYYMLLDLPRE